MDTNLLDIKFARIGAQLKVADRPARRNRTAGVVSLDVQADRSVPPVEEFAAVAGGVRSRLFTMDVAQRRGGEWLIVELGDAQVAGLPEHADVDSFYKALRDHWPSEANQGAES